MQPILRSIQSTLIAYLQTLKKLPKNVCVFSDFLGTPGSRQQVRMASLKELQLSVAIPFPLKVTPDLLVPCWEQLAFACQLTSQQRCLSLETMIDTAEQICYAITQQSFSTEYWSGRFRLKENQPWEWSDSTQHSLKMNFITSYFNVTLL